MITAPPCLVHYTSITTRGMRRYVFQAIFPSFCLCTGLSICALMCCTWLQWHLLASQPFCNAIISRPDLERKEPMLVIYWQFCQRPVHWIVTCVQRFMSDMDLLIQSHSTWEESSTFSCKWQHVQLSEPHEFFNTASLGWFQRQAHPWKKDAIVASTAVIVTPDMGHRNP